MLICGHLVNVFVSTGYVKVMYCLVNQFTDCLFVIRLLLLLFLGIVLIELVFGSYS